MTPQPALPIVDIRQKPWFDWKNRLAVIVRVVLLLVIAFCIRQRETARQSQTQDTDGAVTIQQAETVFPEHQFQTPVEGSGRLITSLNGDPLQLASTMPESLRVVGYRGPSHCLMLMDQNSVVQEVRLLQSQDTQEHVQAVIQDKAFWQQFVGWQQGRSLDFSEVDSVSGATLTSLAIAEGIGRSLGFAPESLKFPKPISNEEVHAIWPEDLPANIEFADGPDGSVLLKSPGGLLGQVLRTGTLSDSISGYQGATELLIAIDDRETILAIQKRSSWDNEPYVSYLDDEPWFWDPLIGKSLSEVERVDLAEQGIEGVSGATMTSVAAAETVVEAAGKWNQRRQQDQQATERRRIRWTSTDLGTLAVVLVGCSIGFTRLRSVRRLMLLWNMILVAYFGLMTGNLISLVVIFGWSASGIAWQLAPGLTVVVAVAILVPVFTRRNIYCSHLCPHGAAQQLLKRRKKGLSASSETEPRSVVRKTQPSVVARRIRRLLQWAPGLILAAATVAVVVKPDIPLAAIEPFQAYIWYVSGTASIVLAVTSLLWARYEPMAWCRFGCGTGRLLDYIRRNAASTKITLADVVVTALAVASLGVLMTA